jgi:hypothetical protein
VSAPVEGLEVRRDGAAVTGSEWGNPIPVDPGAHEITANAPGYVAWKGTVDVGGEGSKASITIPALVAAPKPPEPPATPKTATTSTGKSPLGLYVAGGGVIVVGVGVVFALRGKSKFDDSMTFCRTKTDCDPNGVALRDDARSAGTIATIAFGIGAVAIAGGLVLWATSGGGGGEEKPATTPAPSVVRLVPTFGGAAILGSF